VTVESAGEDAIKLRAVERRGNRPIGELEIRVFAARMIMDRDGVLLDAATALAEELFAAPRDGYLGASGSITLPAGEAFRADMTVTRDAAGGMPAFPYKSVLALGHPDFMIHAALLIVVQHAEADWPAGDAMLQSLAFI
jgi:hypothetical protein